ncbi:DUF6531 domain-containing protein [Pseudofrankia sp. BMG5.37]|uniref:DUF6531 domain-containing protein n=1 Tax=Pseudofrankia sp. BMG5.37 TaxID=3050035 RepID=UPI002894365C|nr:DUF6531 domain-containing protein [Pseudofrankia sp. BMG5.37]MDT3438185.1 DUF6531 domain-containing protein [Pseudofrankia sp. BMG5.37]
MSSEWQAVGLAADPTPGDPEAVRALATKLDLHATTADGGTARLRTIAAGGGGGDLAMRGEYAAGYAEALRDLPDQLVRLARAYRGAGVALAAYATTLTDAKTQSGAALRQGLDAQVRYQGALASVEAMLPPERAVLLWPNDELSPQSVAAATANLETPGLAGQVQVIARQGQDARADQTLAARLAQDARTLRDGAAKTCADGIDEALKDGGIKNRPWWKKAWDFAKAPFTSWNKFVDFCATVALVAGILAAVVFTGGAAAAILGAVALGAGLVVLGDSVVKWRQGRASFGAVLLNAVGVIPGGKALGPALKGLRGASAAVRVGGRGSRLVTGTLGRAGGALTRVGRTVTSAVPFGIGRAGAARGPLLGRADTFARSAWCRLVGRDPIDMASGQMVLTQTDVELPGVLDWALRRTYQSGYTCGRWFGPGWSSSLDLRLEVDEQGVCYTAPDGVLLAFPHPEPGGPAVLAAAGPRVELVLDETGCYSILDAAAGQVLRFAIPAAGQRGVALPLAAVVDRGGNTVEFGYDLDGDLAQVSHSGGYRLDIETRDHLVTAVHIVAAGGEPARELVGYRYDGAGRLTHIVNSSGEALRFDYDTDSRIIRWADRNGTEYRYTYDASGRVVRTEGSDGYLDGTITYDETARITRETNSLGHVTEYHFTGRLRPLRQIDPLGRTTTFAWDRFDNRTAETDPLGRTVRYRYDEAGNLTELERPDGTAVTTTWNEQRRPVTTVDADGARVEREYDAAGNLTAIVDPIGARTSFLYDGRGRLMAVTDALGRVTQIETDPAGMPIAVIDPAGAATSYERDALGRIITVTDPIGGITRFTWTPEGRLTARTLPDGAADTYRYDAEGNLVEHTDPASLTTTTEVTHFDLPATRTSPDGARLTFDYDTELRLIAVTNPQGLVWRYGYDPAGQLVTETDYNGRTLRYGYDPAGQLTTRTNGADQTVTFTRDLLGNVLEKHGPTGVTAFAYDPAGQMVRATGPDAEVTFERDPAGRVVTETIDGRRVVSEYDSLGRRIRRTTPSGAVSHWEYDPTGRPLALHTAGQTLRFTHDAAGRETERLLLPGSATGLGPGSSRPGSLGTGNSARDTLRPTGSGPGSSGPGGSGSGGSGTAVALTQTWDTNHQLLSQTIIAGPLESFGTVSASLARPAGAAVTQLLQRRDFSYSPDGYVTEIDDLTSGLRYFDLDPMRRITTITGTDWQERYAYDTVGNITNATWPTPSPTADPLTAGPAVSGGDGRGDREDDERGEREYNGTLIRRAGAVRYEHDAQGRITLRQRKRLSAKPRTWRYTWDADDRLTTVTTPDGTIWHYLYDPFGRRTAKHRLTTNGTIAERTTFTWDGTLLAEQHHTAIDTAGSNDTRGGASSDGADGGGEQETITWDWEPDSFRPLTQTNRRPSDRRPSDRRPPDHRPSDGADQTWYDTRFHAIVTDLVGTPTELVAPDGSLAWHARTTLWGVTTPPNSDELTCPLRFPGQYHDPESGLNYNYHRYYNPTTARYDTADPLGLVPADNHYGYVVNPTEWVDPLGLAPCKVTAYHYTDRKGFNGIRSGNPYSIIPGKSKNGPGPFFTNKSPADLTESGAYKRYLGLTAAKSKYVIEFQVEKSALEPIRGGRRGHVFQIPGGIEIERSAVRFIGKVSDWMPR